MTYTPTTVAFFTAAPADAPEVKGNTCYFQPKNIEWVVSQSAVRLSVSGPASRVERRQGEKGYFLESVLWPNEVPDWVPVPWELIKLAQKTVQTIDTSRAQQLKEKP